MFANNYTFLKQYTLRFNMVSDVLYSSKNCLHFKMVIQSQVFTLVFKSLCGEILSRVFAVALLEIHYYRCSPEVQTSGFVCFVWSLPCTAAGAPLNQITAVTHFAATNILIQGRRCSAASWPQIHVALWDNVRSSSGERSTVKTYKWTIKSDLSPCRTFLKHITQWQISPLLNEILFRLRHYRVRLWVLIQCWTNSMFKNDLSVVFIQLYLCRRNQASMLRWGQWCDVQC